MNIPAAAPKVAHRLRRTFFFRLLPLFFFFVPGCFALLLFCGIRRAVENRIKSTEKNSEYLIKFVAIVAFCRT